MRSIEGKGFDPSDRFVGQVVEGGHGQFQVLFLRVLDFIVGDAMKALDEHHDGGVPG